MSSRRKGSTTDLLVGIAAIVALIGIGAFLIVDGFEQTPVVNRPLTPVQKIDENRHDTIRTLPLVKLKSDTVYETDSAIMSQSAADRKAIRKEDSLNKLEKHDK